MMFRFQRANRQQPPTGATRATTTAGLPHVSPSAPYSEGHGMAHVANSEQLVKTFTAAREAEARNEMGIAARLYEQIAASYLSTRDEAFIVPELGISLVRSAELAELGGAHGFAAERFKEAARIFQEIAAQAVATGNQRGTELAKREAYDAVSRAEKAIQVQSGLRAQQDAVLRQEKALKNSQFESFASRLGRI